MSAVHSWRVTFSELKEPRLKRQNAKVLHIKAITMNLAEERGGNPPSDIDCNG